MTVFYCAHLIVPLWSQAQILAEEGAATKCIPLLSDYFVTSVPSSSCDTET